MSGPRDVTEACAEKIFVNGGVFVFCVVIFKTYFLPFEKRQDDFHLIEEVLHLIFQLQGYVDFHNCFQISQKSFLNVRGESPPFAFCLWAKPHVACIFLDGKYGTFCNLILE